MAGLIPIGEIASPEEDVFATTGPHLDVRVIPQFGKDKGKKINPETIRSLLQNIQAAGKPIVQQGKDGQWNWNSPITSRFGPRSAPTAGASTYHEGIDLGIGAGTQLAYKGYGTFTPNKGYGTLSTTDPKGQPYDIQFLHTKPAGSSTVASTTPAVTTPAQTTTSTDARTEDILKAFLYGAKYTDKPKEAPKTFEQQLKEQLLGNVLNQALNPQSFLSSYSASNPFIQGKSAATGDFLNNVFS